MIYASDCGIDTLATGGDLFWIVKAITTIMQAALCALLIIT
jgi:hypothetical protein